MNEAVKFYKEVLHQDNMSIEAIACIGTHYFYSDQPEIALKFYRYSHKQKKTCQMVDNVQSNKNMTK